MMGYAAALAAGFDQTTYDLNVLFMPKCWGQGFAGVGWVGLPGSLQNSQLTDYDASVAHELVRNPSPHVLPTPHGHLILCLWGKSLRVTTWARTTQAT